MRAVGDARPAALAQKERHKLPPLVPHEAHARPPHLFVAVCPEVQAAVFEGLKERAGVN